VDEDEFDGWDSLAARRQAEDESLIRRYASGAGHGLDMRPARGFVQHVRRDLGPEAIICDVKVTVHGTGHEVVAWYYFPGAEDGSPAATPVQASVAEVPTQPAEPAAAMPAAADDGLAALHLPSTAAAPAVARVPSANAPARLDPARDEVAGSTWAGSS